MGVDVSTALNKIVPLLLKTQNENLSEADTKLRVVKVFETVLGYDALEEIKQELEEKGKFVDIAIVLDGAVKLLVEVKKMGIPLKDKHVGQAELYAMHSNTPWALLTNGLVWKLYHLRFEPEFSYDIVFDVDLASKQLDEASERLALLHRQSMLAGALEEYLEKIVALNPESIGKALFSEEALRVIRKQVKKQKKQGVLFQVDYIAKAIYDMLSDEARKKVGSLPSIPKKKSRPDSAKAKKSALKPGSSDLVERERAWKMFWTSLLDKAKQKTQLHAQISANIYSFVGTSAGVQGLRFNYVIRKHDGFVELYIYKDKETETGEGNKQILKNLMAEKEEIEKEVGGALEWQLLAEEGTRACRIRKIISIGGWQDEGKWPEQQDAMIDAMIRLEKALRPHLEKLS